MNLARARSKNTMYAKVLSAILLNTDDCILTPTGLDREGYGQLRDGMRMTKAHQLAYRAGNGSIPIGMLVRHTCDVRACINPKHLVLRTVQDNSDDMIERGRSAKQSNTHAKLNWDKVDSIRGSTKSVRELAEEYGVQEKQIIRILRNEQWQDNSKTRN